MAERHLTNWIQSYLQYTEETEPPSIFREWCAVSAIAAALQRKCKLEWGMTTFYPNLYIVLTAPPGRARKGTAMSAVRKFLDHIGIHIAAEATTREALIRRLKESEEMLPRTTGLLVHSSLTIFSPELTVFLGYNNVQLMSDLTDWFDCAENWTYRTKNMGTDDIKGVFINLLGATTPDLIRSTLPIDAVGGGLTSRMIFVYADRKGKIVPYPFLSPEDRELEQKLKHDLELIAMLEGKFRVTKGFLSKWGDWYVAQENFNPFPPGQGRNFAGYIERRPAQVLKLSMIHNAARSGEMLLDDCDLDSAIALLERTEQPMPNALGGIGPSKNAELASKVLSYTEDRGVVSRKQISQEFLYDGTQQSIEDVIKQLTQADLLIHGPDGIAGHYAIKRREK